MKVELGKIKRAEFGLGGYQGAMIGISFDLGGESWGVGDFWGTWATRPKDAKWTALEQVENLGSVALRISTLLTDAKKKSVSQLVGVPVECTFEGNALKSWRILKEVI